MGFVDYDFCVVIYSEIGSIYSVSCFFLGKIRGKKFLIKWVSEIMKINFKMVILLMSHFIIASLLLDPNQ